MGVGAYELKCRLRRIAPTVIRFFRPVRMTSWSVPRRVFRKRLIGGAPLATARGTDQSAQVVFFNTNKGSTTGGHGDHGVKKMKYHYSLP
jgi:hypothetical protein